MLKPEDRLIATGNYPKNADSTDGFLLSLFDGKATLDQVIQMAPVPADDVKRRVANLMKADALKLNQLDGPAQSYLKQLGMMERLAKEDDIYRLLGLSKNASVDSVKMMFRKMSLKFHPDKLPKSLRLDNKVKERSEVLFDQLQEAHDTLVSPDRRREYARKRMRAQRGIVEEEKSDEDEGPIVQEGVKVSTLLHLAQESLARGEYKSARSNLSLAKQIEPHNANIKIAMDELEAISRLHVIFDKLEDTPSVSAEEKAKIAKAIEQNRRALFRIHKMTSQAFRLCVKLDLPKALGAELFHRLASDTMTESDYQTGIRFFEKQNLASTALETAESALIEYPNSAEIKKKVKELKKRFK